MTHLLPARTETISAPVGIDVHRFASFAAFTRAAMTPPLNLYNRTAWDEDFASATSTSSHGGKRFGTWVLGEDCKADNLAEACAWLSAGWPQGLTRMREALGRLKVPRLADVRRRGKWSDVGDVLSHDRLYSGNVERCWRTTCTRRTRAHRRACKSSSTVRSWGTSRRRSFFGEAHPSDCALRGCRHGGLYRCGGRHALRARLHGGWSNLHGDDPRQSLRRTHEPSPRSSRQLHTQPRTAWSRSPIAAYPLWTKLTASAWGTAPSPTSPK